MYMPLCMLFNSNEKPILFTLGTKLIISLSTFCYNNMIFDENCKVQRVYCIANAIKSEWIFILHDITYLSILLYLVKGPLLISKCPSV